MEVYTLTSKGRSLANSTTAPNSPEWGVIFFLSRQGRATNDRIINYVNGASQDTLAMLKRKGIISAGG